MYHAIPIKKSLLKVSEQAVLNTILDFLTYRHIPHAHIRNTGAIVKKNDKIYFLKARNKQKGISDILGVCLGKAFAIEVKSAEGVVSEEQWEWLKAFEKAGGHACIARRLEDVEVFIQRLESQ